jgi:hypothetical protein
MKKYSNIILIMIAALFSSCAKESIENASVDAAAIVNEDSQYLSSFAQILSAAVYNEPELRDYIKKEALAEFDMDHDVFYPFVKDEVVSGGKTFGDILDKYDTEGVLEEIEAHEPLLNILVPDWSWVDEGCFSVKTWDTSLREVAVTYDCTGAEIPLYGKGQLLGSMKSGEFTSMPVLVVKRNERMVYNPTKSGPVRYDFYDPVYDKSRQVETKGTWYDHVYDFDVALPSNTVHAMTLPEKVRAAYTQSRQNYNMKQRDHIYYNMTAVRDTGAVDFHYTEVLYRFRFVNSNIPGLTDDIHSDSMSINTIQYNYGTSISEDALKQYGWLDGNFEIVYTVKAGEYQTRKPLPSLMVKDAFVVDKVHFQWYQDIFGTVTFRKYWVTQEELVPRWITMNCELFPWDLSSKPFSYLVEFEEKDSETTTTTSESETYSYASNINTSGDGSAYNVKVGFGAGSSSQVSRTVSVTITQKETNDDLGNAWVTFSDAVVLNISGTTPVAQLKTYNTGSILFQVVPRKTN